MDEQAQKIINDCCFKCSDYLRIILSEPANPQKALAAAMEAHKQMVDLLAQLVPLAWQQHYAMDPLADLKQVEQP